MIHAICRQCVHRCKQDESVTLMRCARFHKPVTDDEFAEMVRGMDDLTATADDIRRRARDLLAKVRAEVSDGTSEDDTQDVNDAPRSSGQTSQNTR